MPVSEKFRLDNRTAIITGGAVGLGRAMAEALADMQANIVIMDKNGEAAAEAAAAIADRAGVKTLGLSGDVTDPADAADSIRRTLDWGGSVDILLNNAGIVKHIPAEEMSFDDWRTVMGVNMDGVFLMAQAAGRVMIRQQRGSIINIASMSGIIANTPQPQSAYNASKSGVIGLTRSLASEWAQHGIRVNAIAPGYMKTELTKPFFEAGGPMIDTWMKMTPMGRPGTPDELGGLAVYLASDASSFVTGAVFSVDGGYTAW